MKHDAVLTVAITGMNAVPDNPGAGLAVARCLREAYGQRIRIVGLGYDALDPGLHRREYCDSAHLLSYPGSGTDAFFERLAEIHDIERLDVEVVTAGELALSWQPGDGDGRVVVLRPTDAAIRFPRDGEDYVAPNTDYGTGSELGDGSYVVYVGADNNATVTGVPPGEYTVHVFEYAQSSATGQHALYRLCDREDVQVDMVVGFTEHRSGAHHMWVQHDGLWRVEAGDAPMGSTLSVVDATGRVVLTGVPLRSGSSLRPTRPGQRVVHGAVVGRRATAGFAAAGVGTLTVMHGPRTAPPNPMRR